MQPGSCFASQQDVGHAEPPARPELAVELINDPRRWRRPVGALSSVCTSRIEEENCVNAFSNICKNLNDASSHPPPFPELVITK